MILVVGGGLAGLSAAHRLQEWGADYLILEREQRVGGLCRSVHKGGYTFDYSGHLLCLRDPELLAWVSGLLDGELSPSERKASVYVEGSWVPYPFQAHLGCLPRTVMEECLAGLILSAVGRADEGCYGKEDLGSWISCVFGEGISRYFFAPYNEKLFGVPLGQLAYQGVEWSIPRPSLPEAIDGALGGRNKGLGYNPVFHYPSRGGIERLPQALAARLASLRCSCSLRAVQWKRRIAVLDAGEPIHYDRMISTVPLPQLMGLLDPRPARLEDGIRALRWVPVWVLNLGVGREGVSDQHWIYFPEKEFPFFRVGCYTAFGPHLAPQGRSSLYVEVPGHTVRDLGENRWVQETILGLVRCGILRSAQEVELVQPIVLPVAYVVHDRDRLEHLPGLLAFLEEQGIHCAGRYGSWGYGTMEDAIIQGRAAAAKVRA